MVGKKTLVHLVKQFFFSILVMKILVLVEQGAATTVWAALSGEWEGKGGRYLEDCAVSPAAKEGDLSALDSGYKPYAYDKEASSRLWELSNTMVGLPKDE